MNIVNLDTGENEERPEPTPSIVRLQPGEWVNPIPTGPSLHGIPDVAGVHAHLSFAPAVNPTQPLRRVQVPRTPVQMVAGAILLGMLGLALLFTVIWLVAR
jgi:hypothetical protein